MFRIVEWDKHFENNRSRERVHLDWVPFPNKHDGDGYTELLDHADGPAHFGAWCAIVQVASKCDPRGTLVRDGSRSHDSRSLARMTRFPEPIIEAALKRLVFEIGWIEVVDDIDVMEITHPSATIPHAPAENRPSKGSEGKRREPTIPTGVGIEGVSSSRSGHTYDPPQPSPLDVDWKRAIDTAERIARDIPVLCEDDRRFWIKFAALSQCKFSEHWLHDSIGAVVNAKTTLTTRQKHFMKVIERKAIEQGVSNKAAWKQTVDSINIPNEYWFNPKYVEIQNGRH